MNYVKESELIARLCYDLESYYKSKRFKKDVETILDNSAVKEHQAEFMLLSSKFTSLLEEYNQENTMEYANNLELVDFTFSKSTLYISVRVKDSGSIIIGCTGSDGFYDWMHNICGTGLQLDWFGSSDGSTQFYQQVNSWIKDQSNHGNVTTITGHSRGGFLAQVLAKENGIANAFTYNSAPVWEMVKLFRRKNTSEIAINSDGSITSNYGGIIIKFSYQGDILDAITINDYKFYNNRSTIFGTGKGDHGFQKEDLTEIESFSLFSLLATLANNVGKTNLFMTYITPEDIRINNKSYDGRIFNNSIYNLFGKACQTAGTSIMINPESINNFASNIRTIIIPQLELIENMIGDCISENYTLLKEAPQRKRNILEGVLQSYKNTYFYQFLHQAKQPILDAYASFAYHEGMRNFFDVASYQAYELQKAINQLYYQINMITSTQACYHRDYFLNVFSPYVVSISHGQTGELQKLFERANRIKETLDELIEKLDAVENPSSQIYQQLTQEIESTLRGTGLRSIYKDGMSQCFSNILETEKENIVTIKNQSGEMAQVAVIIADNFRSYDLNQACDILKDSKLIESDYQNPYLHEITKQMQRSGIIEDVLTINQAYNNQIDQRTEELASILNTTINLNVDNFLNQINQNNSYVPELEAALRIIYLNEVVGIKLINQAPLRIRLELDPHSRSLQLNTSGEVDFIFESSFSDRDMNNLKIMADACQLCSASGPSLNPSFDNYLNNLRTFAQFIPSRSEFEALNKNVVREGIYASEGLSNIRGVHYYVLNYLEVLNQELFLSLSHLHASKSGSVMTLITLVEKVLSRIKMLRSIISQTYNFE